MMASYKIDNPIQMDSEKNVDVRRRSGVTHAQVYI